MPRPGWILTSLWGSRDRALAAWFLAMALGWMVEPVTVHTLPLALLVLGAAASGDRARPSPPAGDRRDLAAFAVGAVAATAYFAPLVVVHRAIESHDGTAAASAAAWSWRDPLVANLVAERLAIDAQLAAARTEGAGTRERSESLAWSARVPEWAPMSSWAWNSLAFRQIALGDPGAAESLQRVFELDRWNALGWQLQLRWAEDTGDEQLEITQPRGGVRPRAPRRATTISPDRDRAARASAEVRSATAARIVARAAAEPGTRRPSRAAVRRSAPSTRTMSE